MPRRLGSRPFDAEGIPTRKNCGHRRRAAQVLLLRSPLGKEGGRITRRQRRRGFSSIPKSGEQLLPGSRKDPQGRSHIRRQGRPAGHTHARFGVNLTTGDYSRGAEGLWIKDGKIDHPVDGVTVAATWRHAHSDEAVASDLRFFGRIGSPTFVVREDDNRSE